MSKDHLGLFDTPPDRRETRLGLVVVGLLLAVVFVTLPARDVRLREIDSFVPMVDAIMFLGELITATLLYAQAIVFRSRALSILAGAYVFGALLLVPHALTFPGAFAPHGLLGAGVNTTAWIYSIRRVAFPAAVILYVQLRRADLAVQPGSDGRLAGVGVGVFAAMAMAAVVTILTTVGHNALPAYFLDRTDTIYFNALGYQLAILALYVIAAVLLFLTRKSVLDLCLLVALAGWLVQSVLILFLHSRFTAGWYCLFGITLFAHLVVMLALIAESNRLYARLALSTAVRNRERDTRMMSMDAVAAAISHEVGQPLAAVALNASASLDWLTRPRPDQERAIASLRDTLDAGRRTFDVVKSIRAMFAKGTESMSEFDLNDLVRETASLMDRELAAHKVSLRLSLDENLPPIMANRIQLQRVLVNILTNAIESVASTGRRARRIAIESSSPDDQDVLLEIADSGPAIPPETLARIFEPFFTTKSTGTGLGLSLSHTIIEEHGGRLWASPGHGGAAKFHVQMPSSPFSKGQKSTASPAERPLQFQRL